MTVPHLPMLRVSPAREQYLAGAWVCRTRRSISNYVQDDLREAATAQIGEYVKEAANWRTREKGERENKEAAR